MCIVLSCAVLDVLERGVGGVLWSVLHVTCIDEIVLRKLFEALSP